MKNPKFSFVILTWNRYRFLEASLHALIASLDKKEQCEIVVMDNGSTDGTSQVLEKYASNPLVRIIRRKKNYGLNSYKKLFNTARGEYIVIVDDDVLEFPKGIETIFDDYMKTFTRYGFLALNVVQNEYTNGAKPSPESYKDETIGDKTVEEGPTGGWCTCFRKRDYRKVWLRFNLAKFDMKRPEDGYLSGLFFFKLHLKSGIIKNATCLHATGPYYAKKYGHLDREVQKYADSGLQNFVDAYKSFDEGN